MDSTNKDKAVFANIERIDTPDEDTVVLNLKNGNPDLLFQLGQATAVIVEPEERRHQQHAAGGHRARSGSRTGPRARR